jgi:DNA (cytosine-5)-methyltransferase 1
VGGRLTKDTWEGGHRAAAAAALQIDWMTLTELSEAIPPAYAEHVGAAALAALSRRAREAPTEAAGAA